MDLQEFAGVLRPVTAVLKEVSLVEAAAARSEIERRLPFAGPEVRRLREAAEAGFRAGWLTPKANGRIRFGRPAKDLDGFSVDAVWMNVPGPRHRHGNGEIDLCFAWEGTPAFDGHPEGWVVYPPGSVHVPTVTNGAMLILYFLPGGAIEFLKD